jgi:hypothetical protein
MLKTQPAIRRLILKNCRLTSSSGILIARAVKDGLPLQVLDVGNTAIDSNANIFNGVVGAAFAGAMISSVTLQELGLQGTQLCTNIKGRRDAKFESAICLMEALRVSKVSTIAPVRGVFCAHLELIPGSGYPAAVARLQRLREGWWAYHPQRNMRKQELACV